MTGVQTCALPISSVQRIWLSLAIFDLIRIYSLLIPARRILGYKVICDRYIWDTYIDFRLKFPDVSFEKWGLWRFLVWSASKPVSSIILFISADESLKRSILKKEPFSEDIEQRKRRLQLYQGLVQCGKWDHIIDAEISAVDVWHEVEKVLFEA